MYVYNFFIIKVNSITINSVYTVEILNKLNCALPDKRSHGFNKLLSFDNREINKIKKH